MGEQTGRKPIPDTFVFDGAQSRRGYRLNKFSMSMAKAENREAFKADPEAFMDRYGLSEAEKQCVRDRDWRRMVEEHGGNIYMIMKVGALLGQGLYQIGAQQRGETYEEFLATRNASGAR
ncbi:MAG: protocatechuate 3,4-dioxygenase [Rhodospirillaceae bacterium]